MNESFAARLDARIRQAQDHLKQRQADLSRYMVEFEERQEQFNRLGSWLIREIAVPLMLKLSARFENAQLELNQPLRCRCDLRHCVNFPATAYVELRAEHNDEISRLKLVFDANILPVFVQYPRAAEIEFPLETIDQRRAAAWAEKQLLMFLDAYIQLQWLDQYQYDNLVTDPVCGMRISKAHAIQDVYDGVTHFFCADSCRHTFAASPEKYVR